MPKVLLIGWDGAGWNQIHPLLDSGAMPHLARMVETGVMGELASLTPFLPPLLWTSVATGQFADRHGVLDPWEADPRTSGIRPVTRASLRAPQIWDILAQEGLRCQAIGWPVTHPAQSAATCVSNGFAYGIPRSIHPASLESTLAPLRFDPQEWTGDELQLFVPGMASIDQDTDKRLARLAVTLAQAVTVHAAATTLLETPAWDFSAVWFGAVGQACDLFPAGADEVYKDAVSGVYRFLDLLLGRLLVLAGSETVVMLVSDRAARGGVAGMFCAAGPGIEPDELSFGAGLLDVAPTVLGLFGFADAGMPGRAIPEICSGRPARSVRQRAMPAAKTEPPPLSDADLQDLKQFGYTDAVAAVRKPEAEAAHARRDFHLAQVLLAQGRAAEAIPLLEGLTSGHATRFYLAHAYYQCARYAECRTLCEALVAEFPDSPLAPLGRAHLAIAEKDYAGALRILAEGREAYGMAAQLDAAVGDAYLLMERWDEAAAAFRSAIQTDPGLAAGHQGLARALLALHLPEEAAEAALDAIRLRYDLPAAHYTLGRALQAMGREEAASAAFATGDALRDRMPAA